MTFKRWLPTFLAFPLGGFVTMQIVGGASSPLKAAASGLIAGAIIGAGQWRWRPARRSRRSSQAPEPRRPT
jgi:membrane associated rhomboid family serine protease